MNYTPLYYTINGVAFNKTSAAGSRCFQLHRAPQQPRSRATFWCASSMPDCACTYPRSSGSVTKARLQLGGFSLIAEDGNPLPGLPRVQTEVFMAAGKTYDVMINVPAAGGSALPVYDRELSLSANATQRDAGMLAYIGINGSTISANIPALGSAQANADSYTSVIPCTASAPCHAVVVSDPAKGVLANDVNVFGAKVSVAPTGGTLALNTDGTFTYMPGVGTVLGFLRVLRQRRNIRRGLRYRNTGQCTTAGGCLEAANGITVNNMAFTSKVATYLKIASPGVLSVDSDSKGLPLSVNTGSVVMGTGLTLTMDSHGGFTANVGGTGTYYFGYSVTNSQGTASTTTACPADPTVTPVAGCGLVALTFPTGSGLAVTVLDGYDKQTQITDYRWIIEEDKTFYVNPSCTTNPPPSGCPGASELALFRPLG